MFDGCSSANARTSGEAGRLPQLFGDAEWLQLCRHLGLSARQSQIARRLCLAETNDQIAWRLGISSDTVHMHMKALFKKLGVHDRIGVVVRLVVVHREVSARVSTIR